MNVEPCPAGVGVDCPPGSCQGRCAIEVIDEMLSQRGGVTGEQADWLLDLRWQLSRRDRAEEALHLFALLRVQLERSHYLSMFRIRRWLERHLTAQVRSCPAAAARQFELSLDNVYCIEAMRRQCLCRALQSGMPLLVPRLTFAFRSNLPMQRSIAAESRRQLSVTA